MKNRIKTFLDNYNRKMPSNGVPFELNQRLNFTQVSSPATFQNRRPWVIMLNTYIIAATILISGFTFWQLGEDSLFIWSLPPAQEHEVVSAEMVTYLEDNTDLYLDWSIFAQEYLNKLSLKFYVGMTGDDFYLFYYLEPTESLFVRINSNEGEFLISGFFEEISVGKQLIESRTNITIDIYVFDGQTEANAGYVFRIPKYLEIFVA